MKLPSRKDARPQVPWKHNVEGADTETSHEIMVEIQVDFVPADCVAKLVWPSESGGLEFTVFAHMTYHTRAPVAVHTQLSYVCLVTFRLTCQTGWPKPAARRGWALDRRRNHFQ